VLRRSITEGKARPDTAAGARVKTPHHGARGNAGGIQPRDCGAVCAQHPGVLVGEHAAEGADIIANDSAYGLSGGVISADRERALHVARRIRTGSVSVNGGLPITGDLPFGGVKGSGVGREWGCEGIEEFLDAKAIAIGVSRA